MYLLNCRKANLLYLTHNTFPYSMCLWLLSQFLKLEQYKNNNNNHHLSVWRLIQTLYLEQKKRTKTNKACSSLRLQALTGVMWGVRLYSLLLHASSHKRVILRGVSTILAFSFNWNLQLVAASRIYYITRSQVTLRFSIYSLKLKLEKYHPPFRCFCSYSLSLHFIYSVCSFKLN